MFNLLLKRSNEVGRKDSGLCAELSHPPVRMLLRQYSDDIALNEAQLIRLLCLVVI